MPDRRGVGCVVAFWTLALAAWWLITNHPGVAGVLGLLAVVAFISLVLYGIVMAAINFDRPVGPRWGDDDHPPAIPPPPRDE